MADVLHGFNNMLWTGFKWLGRVVIFLASVAHAQETITTPFGELPARIVVHCSSIPGSDWSLHYQFTESSDVGLSEDVTVSLYDEKYQTAIGYQLKSLPFFAIKKLHIAFEQAQAVTPNWKQHFPYVEENWVPAALILLLHWGQAKSDPYQDFEVESVNFNISKTFPLRLNVGGVMTLSSELIITIKRESEIQKIHIMEPRSERGLCHIFAQVTSKSNGKGESLNTYTISFPDVPMPDKEPAYLRTPVNSLTSLVVQNHPIQPVRTNWWVPSCCRSNDNDQPTQLKVGSDDVGIAVQQLSEQDFQSYYDPASRIRKRPEDKGTVVKPRPDQSTESPLIHSLPASSKI